MDTKDHALFRKNIQVWHRGAKLARTTYTYGSEPMFEEWQCPQCEQTYTLWSKLGEGEPGLDMTRRFYVSRPLDSKMKDPRQHSACTPEEKKRLTALQLWRKP